MEARDRLRLLCMEMELQRAWLAACLDDREARAARRRSSLTWRVFMSVFRGRSVWLAAFGAAAEWWRHRQKRTA
jgi:hypothetical protein